jgi:hypothetical protein
MRLAFRFSMQRWKICPSSRGAHQRIALVVISMLARSCRRDDFGTVPQLSA